MADLQTRDAKLRELAAAFDGTSVSHAEVRRSPEYAALKSAVARNDVDREPVATLAHAKQWLWRYCDPCQWLWAPEADMPRAALLVCDMFWLTPSELTRDMRKDFDLASGRGTASNARRWLAGRGW